MDELAQVKTSKKEFLEQIEGIIPWNEWIEIITKESEAISPTNLN